MFVSGIERLPVELLQPIFFLSGRNVALIQASDLIGARLSSDYVYNAACSKHLTSILDDRAVQTATQTYIFASKWMTWTFFKSWVTRTYEPNGCLCGLVPEDGCFDAQWPPNFENATEMVFSRSHLPRLAFVKGRIPKKLLGGPWTLEKTKFLQFLLWITSMTVDWHDADIRQISINGRIQAIQEQNVDVVELFNHNRRLGKVADLSTVRFAVIDCGCNRSIVYDTLLTASIWGTVTSWDCDKLDAWCEQQIVLGDPKGKWLKIKLEELRIAGRYRSSYLGNTSLSTGRLDSETADYDGGTNDQLLVKEHKWNQVSTLFLIFR
jgi:hypothetical protein